MSSTSGSPELTKADKTYLLMVLDHPEVPLHNNPAELDARTRVRKRVVSYGPRSLARARTWDAMETLLSTARKLGVNFFQYIRDRVSGARQMPSLADLIKQRAETMDLGSSWKPIRPPPFIEKIRFFRSCAAAGGSWFKAASVSRSMAGRSQLPAGWSSAQRASA